MFSRTEGVICIHNGIKEILSRLEIGHDLYSTSSVSNYIKFFKHETAGALPLN